jgi:hypothetical protein
MAELKHSGGGVPRYLVAAPLTLVSGALIVSLDWKLGEAVWLRFQMYSQGDICTSNRTNITSEAQSLLKLRNL